MLVVCLVIFYALLISLFNLKLWLFRTSYFLVVRNNYGLILKFLGVVQETSSVEISKSQNLEDVMEKRSSSVSSNDSIGKKSKAGEDRGKQSNKKADLWWLNLPYVLVS